MVLRAYSRCRWVPVGLGRSSVLNPGDMVTFNSATSYLYTKWLDRCSTQLDASSCVDIPINAVCTVITLVTVEVDDENEDVCCLLLCGETVGWRWDGDFDLIDLNF